MQRGHLNGSYIIPEFCEVGYSATLARAQGHNFKGWGKVLAVEGSEVHDQVADRKETQFPFYYRCVSDCFS